MLTVDYEKNKEALDIVKQMVADGHITQDVAERYFPGLVENEDEKMLNNLHSWMKEFGDAEEYTEKVYQWIKGLLKKEDKKALYRLGEDGEYHRIPSKKPTGVLGEMIEEIKEEKEAKMHEAGYEWDAEKKELKKDNPNAINETQQEWSEEDEIALGDALWCCKQAASIAKDENDMGNVWYAERWLKSLKDRVPQPANGVYPEADGVRIWHDGHTFKVPKNWDKGEWPLLNEKGRENAKKDNSRCMDEVDALLDWDFVALTKHIQDLGTDIPLEEGEYLLTAPVFLAMYAHGKELNKALREMGAKEIDFNMSTWFAERYSVHYAWLFGGTTRYLINGYVSYTYQVGAVSL